LRQVDLDSRRLDAEKMDWARAFAALQRAGCAHQRGQAERAVGQLELAAQIFDHAGMSLHAAAARRRWGQLVAGDTGARAVADADRFMRSEAIIAPERIARILVCGFGS
jgi:hypothetical protein